MPPKLQSEPTLPASRRRPTKSSQSETPEAAESRNVHDIEDLVSLVALDNVIFHEERARRIDWNSDDPALADLPSYQNSLAIAKSDDSITFRFRMVFTDAKAEYVADVAAVYSIPEPLALSDALLGEFAERVSFMTVYPFLRSSIYGGAARLGQAIPVLGLVRQGEFQINEPMSKEEVTAAFHDNVSETSASTQ